MARPLRTFAGFVGQRDVVNSLERLVDGSQARRLPLPWLFFMGPAGVGKTSLARATATKYGGTCTPISGSRLLADGLAFLIEGKKFGDVVFIDEAHALPTETQTALLLLADEAKLPVRDEKRRPILRSFAELTVILATNRPGAVAEALRTRCHCMTFVDYAEVELIEIAKRYAEQLKLSITGQAARRLAQNARGRPRHVVRRLDYLHRLQPLGDDVINVDNVDALLMGEGIDAHGLSREQRAYLDLLATHGRASLDFLAIALGLDRAFVAEEIETPLVRAGLVDVGAGGRALLHDPRREQPQIDRGAPDEPHLN